MQSVSVIVGLALLALVILYFVQKGKQRKVVQPPVLDNEDQQFLETHISFYQDLNEPEKKLFGEKMDAFFSAVTITGVKTTVTRQDQLMVAAGAIIPIFRFDDWQYRNLHEVLVYPNTFSEQYALDGEDRRVMGMVGEGALQNVMILSQTALRTGFSRSTASANTAIHEFAHLLDKSDGATDGVPENLLPPESVQPWLQWMHKEMARIRNNTSEIDVYGVTNEAEFFAVVAEYFFTQPAALEQRHPELYSLLVKIFKIDKSVQLPVS